MGIQPLRLFLDTELLERLPIPVGVYGPQVEHRLRPRHLPAHPRSLQPVLDHVTARPLDYPRRYRIALAQVLVVTHPMLVLLEERARLVQPLPLRPLYLLER